VEIFQGVGTETRAKDVIKIGVAALAISSVLLSCLAFGDDAPLAGVNDLECAAKNAVRFDQGAATQGEPEGPTAFVKMVATGSTPRDLHSKSCDVRVALHVKIAGQAETEIALGHTEYAGVDIVDWSPQHDLILISSEQWSDVLSAPDITVYDVLDGSRRSVDVAALFAASGWTQCAAIIETTGFTPDGRIAVVAGPGSLLNRPKDCTSSKSYWAFGLGKRELRQLPANYQQKRYGKVVSPEYRPCKEDPGIVDRCFMIHGRVTYGNGSPQMRIWRVGTDRILGVLDSENEIIPDNLSHQLRGYGVEVYGDFEVCPFTKKRPEEMQMVCVEAASHLVTKER
jgi:hypothetical protein